MAPAADVADSMESQARVLTSSPEHSGEPQARTPTGIKADYCGTATLALRPKWSAMDMGMFSLLSSSMPAVGMSMLPPGSLISICARLMANASLHNRQIPGLHQGTCGRQGQGYVEDACHVHDILARHARERHEHHA